MMLRYEVFIIRIDKFGGTRSLMFDADDFSHAEEQASDYLEDDEQIIRIDKDYE